MLRPINTVNHPVALGDGALYFFEGGRDTGRVIHLSACFGTYAVTVRYETTGATDTSMVESAVTVAQEVLSWL